MGPERCSSPTLTAEGAVEGAAEAAVEPRADPGPDPPATFASDIAAGGLKKVKLGPQIRLRLMLREHWKENRTMRRK